MSSFLKIENVDKIFTRGASVTKVLENVSLRVEKGQFVSIIGHSGCGKSTLLNIVAGLLSATSGGVILEEREVNEPGPDRAMVFQNHSLLPWLSAYDNVRLAVDKVFRKAENSRRSVMSARCACSTSCRWPTPRTNALAKYPAA